MSQFCGTLSFVRGCEHMEVYEHDPQVSGHQQKNSQRTRMGNTKPQQGKSTAACVECGEKCGRRARREFAGICTCLTSLVTDDADIASSVSLTKPRRAKRKSCHVRSARNATEIDCLLGGSPPRSQWGLPRGKTSHWLSPGMSAQNKKGGVFQTYCCLFLGAIADGAKIQQARVRGATFTLVGTPTAHQEQNPFSRRGHWKAESLAASCPCSAVSCQSFGGFNAHRKPISEGLHPSNS